MLVVLGLLTFYVLRGRVSDRLLLPLTVVLDPRVRRVGGGYCRAYILPAVAVLRSPDRFRKAGAPESAGDHPRTHDPRDDYPYRIPERFTERLTQRHAECLPDRRPVCLGDGFGERVSISLSDRL